MDHSVEKGNLTLISMGQGQEKPAEACLDKYIEEGGWVFLDNVHLMQGWVPRLERKLEIASENAHPDFRCFFSAEPINGAPFAKIVPEAILQVRQSACSVCRRAVHDAHISAALSTQAECQSQQHTFWSAGVNQGCKRASLRHEVEHAPCFRSL